MKIFFQGGDRLEESCKKWAKFLKLNKRDHKKVAVLAV